jgi:MATE family multidrug resistance protein
MRNAGVISLAAFLLAAWPLTKAWGNHGLWVAFIIYVIARAGALWPYYRRMEAGLAHP